ncbi:MAG TPA: GFA family protein [Devosia sp.]|nr:GFA family protein [Devosia sp.]
MTDSFTGGCQCGAVRYRVDGPLRHASICNCRMCQKALGNLFGSWAEFAAPVVWTRGRPSVFRSSGNVQRGFCNLCGTPLTYQWGTRNPSITIGSFDRPNDIVPSGEVARDNRHPLLGHVDELAAEPLGTTDEERDILAILSSFQHPDQDTESWTPGGAR